jgi:hypothetical protein
VHYTSRLCSVWRNILPAFAVISAGAPPSFGVYPDPVGEVVDYFKAVADETGLPYQKLIDLYLLDCAKKRKKLTMKWVA